MSNTSKALYLPLSAATSVAGGLLASALFGVIWKHLSDEEPAFRTPRTSAVRVALCYWAPDYKGLCSVW